MIKALDNHEKLHFIERMLNLPNETPLLAADLEMIYSLNIIRYTTYKMHGQLKVHLEGRKENITEELIRRLTN